jgi:Na+/proline symporter
MHVIDWIVLCGTLLAIVFYGVWKTRGIKTSGSYLHGDNDMPWWLIGVSVMATQASAITFLSTPGQGYEDGMRFVQFYFGLPLAMVLLCIVALPLYYKLKVYTAYEFLETRFDAKTRTLTALLFLIQRGLAAGITIYAPSIILSTILGWPLSVTNLIIGVAVIIYTVAGGTSAVSQTQKQQMSVMFGGMVLAFIVLVNKMPEGITFHRAMHIAGDFGKLNILDFNFDLKNRYNVWSGFIGGTFLFLSYFGTDQSQVQRYLSGKSLRESRLGLLFNALFKIPMQFSILLTGVLVFVFFQFIQSPLHFNRANEEFVLQSEYSEQYRKIQEEYDLEFSEKRDFLLQTYTKNGQIDEAAIKEQLSIYTESEQVMREDAKVLIAQARPGIDTEDTDYVFITFVLNYLPLGLIGLLLAVIFSAAMSSTSSELNALATTTSVDIYKRFINPEVEDSRYLQISKLFTLGWGLVALTFALTASQFENLIEAVNIIGSLFYGTILGIFVAAFFFRWLSSNAVFIAGILAEIVVVIIYFLRINGYTDISYLWLNLIGCVSVILIAMLLNIVIPRKKRNK